MSKRIIKGLDIEECRILKHIIIVADKNYGETAIGNVFYKRKLSTDYNLLKQKKEDDKYTGNRIEKLLKEYPQQENYPNDRIDVIILEAIKYKYPKSYLRNDLIIFNTDLEKLEILKNKNKINGKIYFTPNITDLSNVFAYVGKTFESPEIEINIYSDYQNEIKNEYTFSSSYFLDEKQILDELELIEFE
ncbi:hypothetical protein [Flavivirga jejuensis]|uniref:Uncharacterized protein n=1 Tax=Flavivirga jejuensis TaxID=870487 RepID=A0ABT8WLD3_9FLAO|nr:hypothetical protein [Flavivirga jejuensis]MDO5973870.1 hypothetical protein [Flavivirga jejuensis]